MKEFIRFLLVLTVIAIIVGACIIKGNMKMEYDERQKLARGKAFRAAYFVLLAYFVLDQIVKIFLGHDWCDSTSGLGLGVSLSITVFGIVSVLNDAYVGINQNVVKNTAILGVVGMLNVILGAKSLIDTKNIIVHGVLTSVPLNLTIGAALVIVAITLIIRNKCVKQQEE